MRPRDQVWQALEDAGRGGDPAVDVLVVGGGVSGAGVALDLAARGLSVLLVERGDWASGTSSASSRLVHGGLRYLEQLELGLVRGACLERARLLRVAAGLVWPQEFHFPLAVGGRVGPWKLAAGIWLYTLLATPHALGLPHRRSPRALRALVPGLRPDLAGGGSYLDAATLDARLVLALVRTARREGALALPRVEVLTVEDGAAGVRASLRDHETGHGHAVTARCAVLAGGPGTDSLRALAGLATDAPWCAPTRGTHLVLDRARLPTDGAVIFDSAVDGRVMFLLPWPDRTVIGTTDVDGGPPHATAAEVRYLLDSANALVPGAGLTEADVVSTYAGLRPLLAAPPGKDPSERSREERIEREGHVVTLAGGKLTGYREAAEEVGALVARHLDRGRAGRASPTRSLRLDGALDHPVRRPAWTQLAGAGGDPRGAAWDARYGTAAPSVRAACARLADGERALDATTRLGELDWSVEHDEALRLSDFLWRRTDVGLGRREAVEPLVAPLAERMGRLRGWDGARLEAETAAAHGELARRHAWSDAAGADPVDA